jgi:hypothetical protein
MRGLKSDCRFLGPAHAQRQEPLCCGAHFSLGPIGLGACLEGLKKLQKKWRENGRVQNFCTNRAYVCRVPQNFQS